MKEENGDKASKILEIMKDANLKTESYQLFVEQIKATITHKWWYMHRLKMLFCFPEVWGRHWYKVTVTNIWIN